MVTKNNATWLGIVIGTVLFFLSITITGASSNNQAPEELYTIRVTGLASDGVTIMDTPVPTPTVTPTPEPPRLEPPVALAAGCGYSTAPVGYFTTWPEDEVCFAIGVAYCESRWNPHAVSPSGLHHGLFQMQRSWFDDYGVDWELRYDPYVNSALAALVVADQGWWPWSCAR